MPKYLLAFVLLVCCFALMTKAQTDLDARKITGEVLSPNSTYTVTQTRDGYLWIGTIVGLMRFDGVDFTVFDSINTPEIKSNIIIALLEDRRGNLWIGTEGGGLTRRAGSRFFHYLISEQLPGDFVTSLLEDADGNIWIGFQKGGVSVFRNGEFQNLSVADGLPSETVRSLAQDDEGSVWIGTAQGLARWQNGQFTNFSTADGLSHNQVDALRWSPTQGLLIGTMQGLHHRYNGKIAKVVTDTEADRSRIRSIFLSGDGELWIGTQDSGLFRRSAGESLFKPVAEAKGIIFSIYQDSDKAMLVASFNSGLLKFRKRYIENFAAENRLGEDLRAIYETRDGDLWFGGTAPLIRLSSGKIIDYSSRQILQPDVEAIIENAAGDLLLGGRQGISIFDGNTFASLKLEDASFGKATVSFLNDRDGNL